MKVSRIINLLWSLDFCWHWAQHFGAFSFFHSLFHLLKNYFLTFVPARINYCYLGEQINNRLLYVWKEWVNISLAENKHWPWPRNSYKISSPLNKQRGTVTTCGFSLYARLTNWLIDSTDSRGKWWTVYYLFRQYLVTWSNMLLVIKGSASRSCWRAFHSSRWELPAFFRGPTKCGISECQCFCWRIRVVKRKRDLSLCIVMPHMTNGYPARRLAAH